MRNTVCASSAPLLTASVSTLQSMGMEKDRVSNSWLGASFQGEEEWGHLFLQRHNGQEQ
jgi:hypothetical protein